jgi:DnaA family protein
MKQLPLAIAAAPEAAFSNFVVGANHELVQALRAARGPVFYLWGPSGCGKTHLLRAMAAEHAPAGGFGMASPLPWAFDARWSLLVMDDCDQLDGARQQAAFALFVDAATHAVPVVAAGRVPPVDMALRDDLRTRLGWGPVFGVQPLGEHEARTALKREADRRGIALGDEVIDYLLTRFARDLKHLMALLDRIDDYALERQRTVTVPLLRQMFAEGPAP